SNPVQNVSQTPDLDTPAVTLCAARGPRGDCAGAVDPAPARKLAVERGRGYDQGDRPAFGSRRQNGRNASDPDDGTARYSRYRGAGAVCHPDGNSAPRSLKGIGLDAGVVRLSGLFLASFWCFS